MISPPLGRNRRAYRVQAEQAAALVEQYERVRTEQRRADVLDERARIAREIHDVLAHSLGALGIQIQAAKAVLTDTGPNPIRGWTLTWAFVGDQRVTDLWNGHVTQSGDRVSVTNASYDATIAPGASVTIGFTGSSTGSDPPPVAFRLNGTRCQT